MVNGRFAEKEACGSATSQSASRPGCVKTPIHAMRAQDLGGLHGRFCRG